jgi:hypothetical protein
MSETQEKVQAQDVPAEVAGSSVAGLLPGSEPELKPERVQGPLTESVLDVASQLG